MKRAVVKNTQKQIEKAEKVTAKPIRICTREGCTNTLTPGQKKFCSHVCRNIMFNKTPGNGGDAQDKYKPEYATTKLMEYLDKCERGNEPTLIPTESSYIVIPNAIMPSIENYASFIGVHSSTVKRWADRVPEFSHALDKMMDIQRSFLINNGLSGRYNSTIAKLMLGSNHGIIEKKEVDNTHKLIGVVKHLYGRADEIEKKLYGGGK